LHAAREGEVPAEPHPCRERCTDPRCSVKTLGVAHSADQHAVARQEPRSPESSPVCAQDSRELQRHWAAARRLIKRMGGSPRLRFAPQVRAAMGVGAALTGAFARRLPPGGSSGRGVAFLCASPAPLRFRPVRPAPPARDEIPGHRPDRPFRPVRPALSPASQTRRSVACDRRARVRVRIDAGTYAAANNTHPRQPQIHHRPAPQHPTHTTPHTAGSC
jgi:hypothetical protein